MKADIEYASLAKRVFLRFLRIFVVGGLAALTTIPIAGYTWKDLQTWLVALIVAFISGGLAALDKGLRG